MNDTYPPGVFDCYSVTTLDSIGDLNFRSVTRSATDGYTRYKQRWRIRGLMNGKQKAESGNRRIEAEFLHNEGNEDNEESQRTENPQPESQGPKDWFLT